MSLFVTIALSIYTLMHLVVYWGVRPLILGHRMVAPILWVFMAAMIVSPVAMRFFERVGLDSAARGAAWVGYTWMGFVFLAFCLFGILGDIHILILLARKIAPKLAIWSPYGPQASAAVILVVAAAGIYGIMEARDLKIERLTVETDKLEAGRVVRVAQVSDLHLGLMNRREALAPIIEAIRAENPDLIVATGDVVDAQINHLDGLSVYWRTLTPPLGKFAVMGNHEHYAGIAQSRGFLADSGFEILENRAVKAGDLHLVGVDDAWKGDEPGLFGGRGASFALYLKHRPDIAPGTEGLFDLQLSGHTHGGQIYPFRHFTTTRFPMYRGRYDVGSGSVLYVNRGTGTWGPPMRVGAPPELTIIEIKGIKRS